MLPAALARPFGLALPRIEVLVDLYLLIGLFTRAAALAAATLLGVFLVALAVQLVRGHTGNCGCVVGIDNPLIPARVLAVDVLLTARRERLGDGEIDADLAVRHD